MSAKLRLGLIIGGKSSEHEVSIASARNVFQALDRDRYDVVLIGIDRQGIWHLLDQEKFPSEMNAEHLVGRLSLVSRVVLVGCGQGHAAEVFSLSQRCAVDRIDLAFPLIHGENGEDGSLQGLLQIMNVPYVGAGVLGSSIGMDKDVSKRLLKEAGIPVPRFLVLRRGEGCTLRQVEEQVGVPCFVKPANAGSSVGVSRAAGETELRESMELAFRFDNKILIEEAVQGREIETSVLGWEKPEASLSGEIVPHSRHGFYSYDSKYKDPQGAELHVPARLDASLQRRIQDLAIEVFRVLCCHGMGRVDMFLTLDGRLLVNEINTIPGFTGISMYPKLWEASGLPAGRLLDRLIDTALEYHRRQCDLKHSR